MKKEGYITVLCCKCGKQLRTRYPDTKVHMCKTCFEQIQPKTEKRVLIKDAIEHMSMQKKKQANRKEKNIYTISV